MKKKRVIVTGAAGFIGSHVVDALIAEGNQVFSVDDLSGGYKENVNKKSTFINLDLRDERKLKDIFRKTKPQLVYHLAADATEGRSQFTPMNCTQRNYLATLNLIVNSINQGVERFVFTSSMAVYGAQKTPFTEDMEPRPEDIYGISKASSEKALEVLSKVHSMEYVIIRPHNVYGPRQNMADPYRNVIAIFMNRVLQGKPIFIYGDGMQKRAFSYVADMIPAFVKAGELSSANGNIFNLGSDTAVTINEMADTIKEVTNKKIKITRVDSRPQEVKNAFCDHKKAKKVLGFKDRTSLVDGLTQMWKWAVERGVQEPKYMDMEIIGNNMPKTWRKKLL